MKKNIMIVLATTLAMTSIVPVLANEATLVSSTVVNATNINVTKTVNSAVNVRSAAQKGSNILGTLKTGDKVTVTNVINGWNQINFNGQTGYIDRRYLDDPVGSTSTSVATTVPTTTTTTNTTVNTPATDLIYVVGSGETLYTILADYYGYAAANSTHGKILVNYNKQAVVNNGGVVSAGMTLRLPVNLNGKTRLAALVSDANGYVHTVKSTDNLYALARTQYGNGNYNTKIYEANKTRVKNVNTIITGQKIYIPYSA